MIGINNKAVIKAGKLAIVTMAGGQGTRLGHNGPKGTYDIGLETHKSLFELLSDYLITPFLYPLIRHPNGFNVALTSSKLVALRALGTIPHGSGSSAKL